LAKVIAFSIDPVMRVWLSGAATNFRTVAPGDIFNCFGLAKIIQSEDTNYPVDSYIFGNTGTTNYLIINQLKERECFPIPKNLIEIYGPEAFLYLINNGLAAYAGFEILSPS
jgi:hypothetical protein